MANSTYEVATFKLLKMHIHNYGTYCMQGSGVNNDYQIYIDIGWFKLSPRKPKENQKPPTEPFLT